MKFLFNKRILHMSCWFFIFTIILLTCAKVFIIIDKNKNRELIKPKNLSVEVFKVKKGNISQWIWGEGTAFTVKREFLCFEKAGRIVYIAKDNDKNIIREGSIVKKGQILAEIDSRDYIQLKKEYNADLLQAQSTIDLANLNIEKLKDDYKTKQKQIDRLKLLTLKKVISKQKLELMENEFNTVRLAIKKAEITKKQNKLKLLQIKAKIEKNNIDLQRTKIIAPFDGIIARFNIKIGDYASLNSIDLSSKHRSIMTMPIIIIDPTAYEIELSIPAYSGKKIKTGMLAQVCTDTLELKNVTANYISGKVYSITPDISLQARTMQVKIRTLEGKNNLVNGESILARIRIKLKKDCITIPFSVIQFDSKHPFVFKYNKKNKTVLKQYVELGMQENDIVEIQKGLNTDDYVVYRGQNLLSNGDKVNIIEKNGEQK
ncbi:efflux RND transporter periplasmic adaptor subunit [Lentisphaerota bacterium WC36G]|nr:efflux RND transporter periplasmic adaptor subunit [Lentisphaerae bacterium WC36]